MSKAPHTAGDSGDEFDQRVIDSMSAADAYIWGAENPYAKFTVITKNPSSDELLMTSICSDSDVQLNNSQVGKTVTYDGATESTEIIESKVLQSPPVPTAKQNPVNQDNASVLLTKGADIVTGDPLADSQTTVTGSSASAQPRALKSPAPDTAKQNTVVDQDTNGNIQERSARLSRLGQIRSTAYNTIGSALSGTFYGLMNPRDTISRLPMPSVSTRTKYGMTACTIIACATIALESCYNAAEKQSTCDPAVEKWSGALSDFVAQELTRGEAMTTLKNYIF